MARRRFRRRFRSPRRYGRRFRSHFRNKQVPLLPTMAVANGLFLSPLFGGPGIGGAANYIQQGMWKEAAKEYMDVVGINFLGFKFSDGTIWTPNMLTNYATIAVGVVGHMLANKFGINRHIKKIPFVGKYISL